MATKINIDNIDGYFFGGTPYNLTWNFNDGATPSTLSVNAISADGNYQIDDSSLSLSRSSTIKVGNFSFEGYLTDYSLDLSPEQKTLTLEYVDKSIDLERYYVGLHKRHGDKANSPIKNLIILGKEYHPCDTNYDSTIDYAESTKRNVDPCDPCPYMPVNKYDTQCDPVLSQFQIFECYYTFNELLKNLPLPYQSIAVNTKFRAQHTGKLKDVLSAWCSDLGMAYYWDIFSNKLVFVDRSKPLSIPNMPDKNTVLDLKYGSTKKNTFSRGFLGYYSKQGEIKSYTCSTGEQSSDFITLNALTLGDIFSPATAGARFAGGMSYLQAKEIQAAISRYGRPARDSYLWFVFYGVKTASIAKQWIGKPFTEFGNFNILDVYSYSNKSANYETCKSLMSSQDLQALKDSGTNYYFIVAEVNDELADQQFTDSQNLANNFLGKYWFKRYNQTIPGSSNSRTQISVDSPDGSAQWYALRDSLKGLEIFNFGHESASKIATLANDLGSAGSKNTNPLTADGGSTTNKTRAADSFILLNRDAKWDPNGDSLKDWDKLFKWFEDINPKLFPSGTGRNDILFSLYNGSENNKNIKLFIAFENEYSGFSIGTSNNYLEASSKTAKIKTEEDKLGNTINTTLGYYGLSNNSCIQITMPGNFVIRCPSQSFAGYNDGNSGYVVHVDSNAKFTKVIPKQQFTITKLPSSVSDVAQVDFNFKEIKDTDLTLINNSKACIPSNADVSKYINDISSNSAFTMASAQRTMSFKMPGVMPRSYSISQGLNSVQFNITDNGAYTTYSFEDKVIQPPGDEYIMQNLLDKAKPSETLSSSRSTTQDVNMVKKAI